ncbi:histone chaperone Rttp106-like-domain-containing protein [Mycena maculata]|uniref:Histone chaperone Rttp106-like-domain-containing protein n=1 Tax=Mycena maculata TaxID=230809 RepID=A0AAD7HQP2_9AGAR|nr:histone chaperone Rttp106-like-domain-containing protein [Mycena maculata]
MSTTTPFLDAISPTFPAELSESLAGFQTPAAAQALDNLIRFVAGGVSPDPETQQHWSEKQHGALTALGVLTSKSVATNGKRQREQDIDSESGSKRQKTEDDGPPLLTLHAISTTSPVRKKVDITVNGSSVQFLNPSTGAVESSIPLSALTRAFLLPTRGKMKPHWTVVILPSDTPDRGKKPAAQAAPQIIFGLDATASTTVKYSTYVGSTPDLTTLKGGAPTRAVLLDFIARLRLEVLEPVPAVFRSACPGIAVSASEGGVPGIEAYRAAKGGTLWFLRAGVLWGESKPCEFWPLESLLSKADGLRVVSATGRTCTVVLTRKSSPEELAELDAGEADPGVETAFSLIDGKEQEGINKWVREHRDLFGKEKVAGAGAVQVQDDSDEEDDDFEADSESDGGSATSGSSSGDGSDDDESGSEEAEDSDEGGGGDGDEDGDEEEELRAENHPLMRPGAMPRMSRTTIDMVAAMMEGELVGDMEDDGEDELED